MVQTIVGHFDTRAHADEAVHDLTEHGMREDTIAVLNDPEAAGMDNAIWRDAGPGEIVVGALGGGLVGGMVGFLVGGLLKLVPGLNLLIAASVLTETLGFGLATMVAGAILGALLGVVLGGFAWARYPYRRPNVLGGSGAVVQVRASENERNYVAQVLRQHGADSLSL